MFRANELSWSWSYILLFSVEMRMVIIWLHQDTKIIMQIWTTSDGSLKNSKLTEPLPKYITHPTGLFGIHYPLNVWYWNLAREICVFLCIAGRAWMCGEHVEHRPIWVIHWYRTAEHKFAVSCNNLLRYTKSQPYNTNEFYKYLTGPDM